MAHRPWLLIYLLAVNILAFALFTADKAQARRHRRRVAEKILMLAAGLGGSVGALLAMRLFHHKTNKRRFRFGLPLLLLAQLTIVFLLLDWHIV